MCMGVTRDLHPTYPTANKVGPLPIQGHGTPIDVLIHG